MRFLTIKNITWSMAFSAIGWLAVWGGYNTDIFNTNTSSLSQIFHGARSLLPVLAGIPSLIYLVFKKKSLSGGLLNPLGLLTGYSGVGAVASFFSTRTTIIPLWWSLMFASVIFVVGAVAINDTTLKNLSVILKINWLIAPILAIGMMGFFLIQPGVIQNLTFNSLFAYNIRPFEGGFGVAPETPIINMVGTRPTGMARYAAIGALVSFCLFLKRKKGNWWCFGLFLVLTSILLFSRGKTEILAFLVVLAFVFLVFKKFTSPFILIFVFMLGLSLMLVFGNIPYRPPVPQPDPKLQEILTSPKVITVPDEVLSPPAQFTKKIFSLSGRLAGPWKQALEFIKQKPMIGHGFASERYLVKNYIGAPASVDSTILNSLLQAGILGMVLFLAALGCAGGMAWHIFKHYSIKSLRSSMLTESTAVMIFIMIRGLMQSFNSYGADWIFIAPIIAYIQVIFPSFAL